MNDAPFAPHPWTVSTRETVRIKDATGATVAIATNLSGGCRRDPAQVQAHARGIAALPELLAALEEIAGDGADELHTDIARAALFLYHNGS